MKVALIVAGLFLGCAAPTRVLETQCNDTISCQKQEADRKAQFARAVAAEPLTERLGVEFITQSVFVDRQRGLVYALGPGLVALELDTGATRWKAAGASGDTLWRAGRYLVVGLQGTKLPPRVTFVDPELPSRATTCTLELDAPTAADAAFIDSFDRAGAPYVYWRSSGSYRGGTPPDEHAKQRERDALACGILKIDPLTCAVTPVAPRDFHWKPVVACSANSALLDLPAAAASAPPVASKAEPMLSVKIEETTPDRCSRIAKSTLEARSARGVLLWAHPLGERRIPMCAPP